MTRSICLFLAVGLFGCNTEVKTNEEKENVKVEITDNEAVNIDVNEDSGTVKVQIGNGAVDIDVDEKNDQVKVQIGNGAVDINVNGDEKKVNIADSAVTVEVEENK